MVGAVLICCTGPVDSADGGDSAAPLPVECSPDLSYLDADFASIGPYGDTPPEEPGFERPEGSTIRTAWRMPPDRSSAYQQWLVDEQPFQMRIRWMLGTDFEADDLLRLTVFIEGRAVALGVDGRAEVALPVVDGLCEYSFEIPASQFPTGLSTLHVHRVLDQQRDSVWSGGSVENAFAVFRGTAERVAIDTETDGYRVETFEEATPSWVYWPEYDVRPVLITAAPADGAYRFELNVHAAPSAWECEVADTLAIVAMLDGRQIEISSHHRLMATLGPGERRVFDVEFRDLPVDGQAHRLALIQLSGIGHPIDGLVGSRWVFTPWAPHFLTGLLAAEWQ